MKFTKVLFLGAHPDDEFGCSGSMSRFIQEGSDVFYAVFSFCEESVPDGFPRNILHNEFSEALRILNIKSDNVLKYNFKVRYFSEKRQNILEEMIVLKKKISPDLVLVPALSDIHQDHHTIAMEGLRAFKHCTILGYELPMNTVTFKHACFIPITKKNLDIKIESLMCYKSQSHKPYANEDFVRGLAKIRGVQIGEEFAEAFEVVRLKV